MAEDVNPQPATTTTGAGDERVGVMLDERELRTFYANAYRMHTSAEEVVIDLGFNMPQPQPQCPGRRATALQGDRSLHSQLRQRQAAGDVADAVDQALRAAVRRDPGAGTAAAVD